MLKKSITIEGWIFKFSWEINFFGAYFENKIMKIAAGLKTIYFVIYSNLIPKKTFKFVNICYAELPTIIQIGHF